jgi:hypothetical protein
VDAHNSSVILIRRGLVVHRWGMRDASPMLLGCPTRQRPGVPRKPLRLARGVPQATLWPTRLVDERASTSG